MKKMQSNDGALKRKMLNMGIADYKVYFLWWKYAKDLLPDKDIKTFEDLVNKYSNKFPKTVTLNDAEAWLYEPTVQECLKELLKSKHQQRLIELYNIYYEKAKTDVQAFRAFIDFSKTFFGDTNNESELQKILNSVRIDEEIEVD